jgi:membrane associated rhomboid family serine protease
MRSYIAQKEHYLALWRQAESFPRAPGPNLIYYPVIGRIIDKTLASARVLQNPNFLDPVLISRPVGVTGVFPSGAAIPDAGGDGRSVLLSASGYRFLPVTESATTEAPLGIQAMIRMRRQVALWALFYWVLFSAGFAALELYRAALAWCLMSGLGAAYYWRDYLNVRLRPSMLVDRFWYYGWLYSRCRFRLLLTVGVACAVGIVQLLLVNAFGSVDALLSKGAVIFETSDPYRWFRFFSAPLLHSGLGHYASNILVLALLSVLAGPHLGRKLPLLLYFSSIGSLFVVDAATRWWSFQGDGIVGLSGGLGGILGWLLGMSLRCGQLLPRCYGLNLWVLLAVVLLALPMVLSMGSFICHLIGCLLGLSLVFVIPLGLVTSGWARPVNRELPLDPE